MLNELLRTYLEIAVEEGGDTEGGTTLTGSETGDGGTGEGSPNATPEETFFELDGEKLTPAQIKEFKQGYLRQSDYTKKTQELSAQKKTHEQALQLFEYLNSKPELIAKLNELDTEDEGELKNVYKPQDPMLNELSTKVKAMEINHELEMLKIQDPELNEIEILNLANEKVMPIKDAYTLWRGLNFDKILKDKLAKQSSNLTEQIKKGNNVTTLMNPNDKPNTGAHGLSEAQMSMADKLGMTYEEYKKWS